MSDKFGRNMTRLTNWFYGAAFLTMGGIAGNEFMERREAQLKLDDVNFVIDDLKAKTVHISEGDVPETTFILTKADMDRLTVEP